MTSRIGDQRTNTPAIGLNSFPGRIKERSAGPRKWLLAVACAIGLVAACGGFAVHWFVGALNDSKNVEAQLSSFLKLTSNAEIDDAYVYLSTDLRKELTLADFRTLVTSQPYFVRFEKLETSGWEKTSGSGGTVFRYEADITYTTGQHADLDAVLIKEDGFWKIRSLNVTTALVP